jgi:parallel beta-helix repeat protein
MMHLEVNMRKTGRYAKPIYVMVALALALSLGVAALPVAQTAEASPGIDRYVSTAGNNSNDGLTWATAWRTITHAVETGCPAGNVSDPNIIHVAAGTYNASGGENFAIGFEKANVSLIGAGAGNTTIDRETAGTGTILGINATGITVQGFTLDNAQYGIEANVGGFNVLDNVFSNDTDYDINTGVYVDIDETDRDTDFSFDDVLIEGNEFYIDSEGVWLLLSLDFDDTATGLNATVGDVDILDNVFDMEATDGVNLMMYLYELTGGTVDIGDIAVSNGNEFHGGCDGVFFDSYLNDFNSTAVSVGSFMVNDNFFEDQSHAAVYIQDYYHSCNWNGTTAGTLGDLEITGNDISSNKTNSHGIYVDYYAYWENFYDNASLTAGNVYIDDNDPIDVEHYAIYFDYYHTRYLYDDAWITLGDLSIQRNSIDAGDEGMEVWYELGFFLYDNSALTIGDTYIADNDVDAYSYGMFLAPWWIGCDMYGNSTVTFGNITIERNDVYAEINEAIYVSGPHGCGRDLSGHSAVTMGDINIVDNNAGIVAENNDAIEIGYKYCGYNISDYSMAAFGDVNIEGNIIDAGCDAIKLYFDEVAYDLEENAKFLMGDTYIVDNQVASGGNGTYIHYRENFVGSYVEDDSYARLADYVITGNTFNVTGDGIFFDTFGNPYYNSGNATVEFGGFLIDDNDFSCDHGIYFDIEDVCETSWGDAVTTMGDVDITNNEFHGLDSEAVYIYYNDLQYLPEDNSALWVDTLTIVGNLVDGASNGIKVEYDMIYGAENSTTTMFGLDIYSNEVGNVTGDGIHVRYNLDAHDNSAVTVGRALIQDNILDGSSDNGVYMGMNVESAPNATASVGGPLIEANTIDNWQTGIYLEDVVNGTIIDNAIRYNGDGIYLDGSDNITILYNGILSNTGTGSGVHLDSGCGENTAINCNSIEGNSPYGVYTAFATVNATNNYWGCSEGPGAAGCDTVIGNVTYHPCLPMEFWYCPVCGGTPPVPVPVGGEAYPINKAAVLVPWIALGAAMIAAATVFIRRRGASSRH